MAPGSGIPNVICYRWTTIVMTEMIECIEVTLYIVNILEAQVFERWSVIIQELSLMGSSSHVLYISGLYISHDFLIRC